MNLKKALPILILIGSSTHSLAQAINTTTGFRMMDSDRYVRLNYENDFFSATDYYYTQGINLEVVHPALSRTWFKKLLWMPGGEVGRVGIAVEHNGYTPTSILSDEILYGDRPFAADLSLRWFGMSPQPAHRRWTSSSLTLGVIGPAAGGYAMQSTIHHWIDDVQPLGWQNQIQNDLVLNYEVVIEQNLWHHNRSLLVNALGGARLGTLNSKAYAGFTFMMGKVNSSIAKTFCGTDSGPEKEMVSYHFYFQPLVNAVGYDATMQGGFFNSSSSYVIASSDIDRLVFQANYGVVLDVGSVSIEYFQTFLSREFSTGTIHRWGGLRVGVSF